MRIHFLPIMLALCAATGAFAQTPKYQLDTTTFVVLGEGLAAGMADFSLRNVYQQQSFPALVAQQLKTAFPQPTIQPPGIGSAPGFTQLEVTVPALGQTTVRDVPSGSIVPTFFIFNLSVPGMKLADAISRRPVRPIVQKDDMQQTVINLILGYPQMVFAGVPLWNQLEYAVAMNPTLALVELGYYDVLDAAVKGDATLLPDAAAFQTNYAKVVSSLTGNFANVIVTTIPNPLDTAYFTSLPSATRLLGAPPAILQSLFNLRADDLLTIPGMMAAGTQITSNKISTLPAGSVLSAATAAQVTSRVTALNSAINTVAQANGAIVYDLNAFFARLKSQGVTVGTKPLTADFQGGIYSLDGYYPGTTVHALIANEILTLVNKTFSKSYDLVNPTVQLATDPVQRFTPAARKPGKPETELRTGRNPGGEL